MKTRFLSRARATITYKWVDKGNVIKFDLSDMDTEAKTDPL